MIQLLLVITLRGSIHKGNSDKQLGGALFMDQGARLYDNRSLFFHNTATTGGALYTIESEVIIAIFHTTKPEMVVPYNIMFCRVNKT